MANQPNTLSLLAKAAFKRSHSGATLATPPSLPQCILSSDNLTISPEFIQRFHHVVNWSQNELLHPCAPHILAFPLHLKLMLQKQFPFALLGLVHIRNEIEQFSAIDITQPIDIKCFFSQIVDHQKGWQFTINTEVNQQSQLRWLGKSVNLFRTAKAITKPFNANEQQIEYDNTCTWNLSGNLGRKYAKVSGDYNLIHLTPLTAKLFGFKQHIAHGMWTKSRCLSELSQHLAGSFRVIVDFKKPLFIPSQVNFRSQSNNQDCFFTVDNKDSTITHLTGQLSL